MPIRKVDSLVRSVTELQFYARKSGVICGYHKSLALMCGADGTVFRCVGGHKPQLIEQVNLTCRVMSSKEKRYE